MNNLRALVADDESKIRQAINVYLKNEGYTVEEAEDGEQALDKFGRGVWDIVLLDVMMPKMDGMRVCQEIRKTSHVPIIMLTAKNDEIDRILGLEFGADDYIGKPFSPRELVARIKAIFRRMSAIPQKEENILRFPGLTIHLLTREVSVTDRMVALTLKEFDLLTLLAKYPGRVFNRDQLLQEVWGFDYYGDIRTVDTHMNRLREKLRSSGAASFISTVWGLGYKFEIKQAE